MTSQAGMRRQETTRITTTNGTSLLTGGLRKRNGLIMTGDRARLRTTTSKLDKQDKLQLHLDYQNLEQQHNHRRQELDYKFEVFFRALPTTLCWLLARPLRLERKKTTS